MRKLIAPLVLVFLSCGQAQAVILLQIYKLNSQEVTFEKPLKTTRQCDDIKEIIVKFQKNIHVETNYHVSCRNLLEV